MQEVLGASHMLVGAFHMLALGGIVALVAAACTGADGRQAAGAAAGRTFRLAIVEPKAIDPYSAEESEGILVTKALFEGLLTLDPDTGDLAPGVAKTWSSNAECTEWTFQLRRGTRFSNREREAVTAQSFIRGMTRAARQKAASPVAYHMKGITGYDERHGTDKKKATASTFSGLSAPAPHTLRVTLRDPDCEFDYKTVHPVMSPVPKAAGEAANREFNDLPVGNGPFKMAGRWRHDRSITLVRNEAYHGEKPFLDRVELTILPSQGAREVEYRGFEAGLFDFARIPPALLVPAKARYQPRGGFISKKDTLGINYLLPNVVNPPLVSPKARKAISLAIDRDAIIDGVFKGFQRKAQSLVPPLLRDYPEVCDACAEPDLIRARRLAKEAGLVPGTPLTFAYDTGRGHDVWVQAVAQQLRDKNNLGLRVDLRPFPFRELLEEEQDEKASGLFRAAWIADYPTTDNFLFPLLSKGADDNSGRYDNRAFDDLLSRARATRDVGERARLTREAERLAIGEDLALIPLWYTTEYRVFDTRKWRDVALDSFNNPVFTRIRPN